MSRFELYSIGQDGEVLRYAEERNACAGAMLIWMEMADKYGLKLDDMFNLDPVWKLAGEDRLSRADKIILASTFDRVWIKREHLKETAEAWDEFWQYVTNKPRQFTVDDTIPRVAAVLRKAADDETIRGICFNHTSVCSNPWRIREDDDESRPFNFDEDEALSTGKPWELFEWLDDK